VPQLPLELAGSPGEDWTTRGGEATSQSGVQDLQLTELLNRPTSHKNTGLCVCVFIPEIKFRSVSCQLDQLCLGSITGTPALHKGNIMLKRKGQARPYTRTLDGGWGWMTVFHFFLVSICFPFSNCLDYLKVWSNLTRPLRKSLAFEWTLSLLPIDTVEQRSPVRSLYYKTPNKYSTIC
jgi:hypothetical protein